MKLTLEEKQVIDKYLYKYERWGRLRRACLREAAALEAKYGQRSPSDFSQLAELGTNVVRSTTRESPQERAFDHKLRVMRAQLDYAEVLALRRQRVEMAMEDLEPAYKRLVEERYFKRKSMDECVGAIKGMTEHQYKKGISEIRNTLADYVLGVFAPP